MGPTGVLREDRSGHLVRMPFVTCSPCRLSRTVKRQVAVAEVIKDKEMRAKYDEVLRNGK